MEDGGQKSGFGVWSGDGKDIVTGAFQEQPTVWNASTGKVDAALAGIIAGALKPETSLTSLAMSASGKFIAEADSKGVITVVSTDPRTIEPPVEYKQDGLSLMHMVFNPVDDRQLLAIYQGRAVLWEAATNGKSQVLNHKSATVMQAAFDPKGQFIVTAANDGTVRLFKLSRGVATDPVELRGHHGPVFAIDVAPDGTIVSGSGDGSVRFWQAEPVGSPSRPESFETKDVDKRKSFVTENLPYLDYGREHITIPAQFLCTLSDVCAKN